MSITVRIPSPLRRLTNGADKVQVDSETLSGCIDALEKQFPGFKERLIDEDGNLRHFVNVYVNGEDIRFIDDIQTKVQTGDEVSIVPAVAGGA
jgi:molybdopterin synthase sulfur carrier subunit